VCQALDAGRLSTAHLVRFQEGDSQAFAELVPLVGPVLATRLRTQPETRRLRPEEIEDVIQDAYLHTLESRRFDPTRGSALTWFGALTHNAAINLLRRKCRRDVSLFARDGRVAVEPAAACPTPLDEFEEKEQGQQVRRAVQAALADVGPRMRQAWALRYEQGLPYHAVAKELGVPPGTVARWVHQVRLAVRAALK